MPPVLEVEELKPAGPNGGGPRDLGPGGRGGGGDDDDHQRGRFIPGAALLAMRFVLVSITVLFLTVGIAYFVRSRSPVNWQHIQVPHLLWLSTALILASSWTLESARRNTTRYVRQLEITLGIAVAFLASQIFALQELAGQGIYLRRNPHSSLFYVVTGAHGLHLLGGMAALCYLLLRTPVRPRSRIAVAALYWHFLTVLWLGLFLFLLLWP
ncbi:MAG TPA: cytochrome c oxidase subunit 3 [Bryobacteraceae bacterium]